MVFWKELFSQFYLHITCCYVGGTNVFLCIDSVNWLNLLIRSSRFFEDSLVFLHSRLYCLQVLCSFTPPFPICMPLIFLFLSYCTGQNFSTTLNGSGESRNIISLFPFLGESSQSFTIKYNVSGRLFVDAFYQFGELIKFSRLLIQANAWISYFVIPCMTFKLVFSLFL